MTGISPAIYFVLGFFGAALWGSNTSGNLLQNTLGTKQYQFALNLPLGGVFLLLALAPFSTLSRQPVGTLFGSLHSQEISHHTELPLS